MPETEVDIGQAAMIKAYLESRPNTLRIGMQPGGLWNADGEAVYIRQIGISRNDVPGSPNTNFMLCSEQMAEELTARDLIPKQD